MWYVYKMFGAADELLYVGCSEKPLGSRLKMHRHETRWLSEVRRLEVSDPIASKATALEYERKEIVTGRPKFNVMHNYERRATDNAYAKLVQAHIARRIKAVEMRSSGSTLQEIADVLGISRQRAHQILKGRKHNGGRV